VSADITAGEVAKRHGAYLVTMHDPCDELGVYELSDAASSLREAKRILRTMVEDYGFEGPFRWLDDGVNHTLMATTEPERYDYK